MGIIQRRNDAAAAQQRQHELALENARAQGQANNPLAGLAQILGQQQQGQQQQPQQQIQYQQPQSTWADYATKQIGDTLAQNQAVVANKNMQQAQLADQYRTNLLGQLGAENQSRISDSGQTERLQIGEGYKSDRLRLLLNSLVPALAGSGGMSGGPNIRTNYNSGVTWGSPSYQPGAAGAQGQSTGYSPPSSQAVGTPGGLDGPPSSTPQGAAIGAYRPQPPATATSGQNSGGQGWAGLPGYMNNSFSGGTAADVRRAAASEYGQPESGATPYQSNRNRVGTVAPRGKVNPLADPGVRRRLAAQQMSPGYSPLGEAARRYA